MHYFAGAPRLLTLGSVGKKLKKDGAIFLVSVDCGTIDTCIVLHKRNLIISSYHVRVQLPALTRYCRSRKTKEVEVVGEKRE